MLNALRLQSGSTETLISMFGATEFNDALRAMKRGHVVKPVVVFDG